MTDRATKPPCSVAECGTLSSVRGLCDKHYQRLRKNGDVNHVRAARRIGVAACSVDGCESVIKAREVCAKHLHRIYRHGAAEARVRAEVVSGCRVCAKCKRDVPLAEWVEVAGKLVSCRDCYLAYMRTHNSRRRAQMRGAAAEDFAWIEIFERDDWVCGICDGLIDPAARWPEPMSPSLDHVIPLARGGAHTRANAQASHLVCNMRKQARMEEVAA